DPRAGADRRPTRAAPLGRLAGQWLGRLWDSQAPWAADALGTADPAGSPGGRGPGRADGADAATGPAARRRPAAWRSGLPGCLLRREAQGRGQGLAAHGLRCGLLVRDRHARATGDPGDGRDVSAGPRRAALPAGGPSGARRLDRWRAGVLWALPAGLSRAGDRASAHQTAACVDQWLRRTAARHNPERTVAGRLPANPLHEHCASGAGTGGPPSPLQPGTVASCLTARETATVLRR